MKKTITALFIGAMTLASYAGKCKTQSCKTIVETAVADGNFKTLAAALGAADLADALNAKGPYTVFAPTDAAFAKLPEGVVTDLLKPANKSKLQEILKYHVISGNIGLSDALKAGNATTLQSESVKVSFKDGKVLVNGATLLNADLKTSNGVIHVIDSVLLPPAPANDIASVAKKAGQFKTLLAAVDAAGLNSVLTGKDQVTVLAPTDAAFQALPKGTVEALLKPESKSKLADILSTHVIKGSISAGTALNAGTAQSFNKQNLKFEIANGIFKVNGVTITKTDIKCDNGVIHVIDAVILPKKNETAGINKMELIENAINHGAPVYNQGNHKKCAQIYLTCAQTLAKSSQVDPSTRKMLQQIAIRAQRTHCPIEQAWMLREGLDHAYHATSACR